MDDVMDSPAEELVVDVDQSQDQPIIDGSTEEAPEGQNQPEDRVDGRKFNPEWSKALKELRELHPDRADMLTKLRDHYARYQALTELAPKGLEDVRGWKTTVDALGGPEAAASLMERAAQIEAIDERIASADFSVIGELPENMQAGFYRMVPEALSHMSESDPQAFAAAVKPHFQAALKETGLAEHLENVYGLLGDNEQAKSLVKQAYDWIKQQVSGAGSMPNGGAKTADPQVRALQEKLSKYEQSDDQKFVSSVTDASQKHLETAFGSLSDVYIKQLNLTKEQQSDLMDTFNAKLTNKLASDTAFQSQLKAFKAMKSRSPEAVTSYIQSKIDEHAKPILDSLVTTRYGAKMQKPRPAPAAGTQPTNNGAVKVAQIPDQSEWDMNKMTAQGYENTAKKGIYYLKDGRTVQVARAS